MITRDWSGSAWRVKQSDSMNHKVKSTRSRVVRFGNQLTLPQQEELRRRLSAVGLEGAEFVENKCIVHYPFPELTLSMIHDLLAAPGPGQGLKPENHLYDLLLMFMEANEHSQLSHAGGWQHNIEDIYIHYFEPDSFSRENLRRQTWRKYKE